MFELSVACKYLLPRWRQLSVSIISLISILVISLVVWLIVVFFSVSDGLEKGWIHKLTALTAPLRITPTDTYYQSYYYQVDGLSAESDFSYKSIGEKRDAIKSDPYDGEIDQEIPSFWPDADRISNGQLIDPVKLAYASLNELNDISGLRSDEFELTLSHINLRLLRPTSSFSLLPLTSKSSTESMLSYPAYLGNFSGENQNLSQTILPIRPEDVNNYFTLLGTQLTSNSEEDGFSSTLFHQRLNDFFDHLTITRLKSGPQGWVIPRTIIPEQLTWIVCAIFKGETVVQIMIPQLASGIGSLKSALEDLGLTIKTAQLSHKSSEFVLTFNDNTQTILSNKIPFTLQKDILIPVQLNRDSINAVHQIQYLQFVIELNVQGVPLKGVVPFQQLEIAEIKSKTDKQSPFWIHKEATGFVLPQDPHVGEGVLLPKGFKEAGVFVGDRGFLTYLAPTASTIQEQQLPIYVAGFYDPGIIPIGGKFILANRDVLSLIRSSQDQDDRMAATNGINVHFNDLDEAKVVKERLLKSFKENGIDRYWHIETYREYEFTKEIMQELQSQKTIFTLISIVIIIVACSNIISMLIILVNDKKTEIGILRSMGASSLSIALIFGLAGAVIGILGSLIGIGAAIFTLDHLQTLIGWISHFQGYDMFNNAFYGEMLPQELSYRALSFVLLVTMMISLLAGVVPAVKACLLRPAAMLRSSGG